LKVLGEAAMGLQTTRLFEFENFRLDERERQLLRNGEPIPLTPKAFDTLVLLLENGGHAVAKDALMQRVWPDAFVEEATLAQNIRTLRKALGQTASGGQYIETIPKHGYRFATTVRQSLPDEPDLIIERSSRSSGVIDGDETSGDLGPAAGNRASTHLGMPAAAAWMKMDSRKRITWLLAAVCLLALGAGAVFRLGQPRVKQPRPAAPRTIAVLPFNPISVEGHDEYLELGMADSLITKLSNIQQIVVRPTSAVRAYSNSDRDPVAAGRDLKVESVLEGSVEKIGDRVRVSVRLIDVRDGKPLWGYECKDRCSDVFELQDSISERIAGALALALTGDEKRLLAKRYTDNAEAYGLYLRGRYFWNKRTREGLEKAIEYFHQAIDVDAGYALAYAGLADCYNVLGSLDWIAPKEGFARVQEAATKALELDDTLAEAHNSLAWVRFDLWDWAAAESEFKRALDLNPNYAAAHQWYAEYLTAMGRFDEAIAEIRRAQQLEPESLIINTIAAQTYYYARQYDQAIEQCRRTLELDPNFEFAYVYLGYAYIQKRMYGEAIAAFKRARQWDGTPRMFAMTGVTYAISGDRANATKALGQLLATSKQSYIGRYGIAEINASLGNRDEALEWLEKEYLEHANLTFLKVEPCLDGLREDPRFTDLLRRMRLL
jgi:DNA-binding winged helix-turn-helix (wHTH) protein/TolB-like protein/Flp pilus assembly protein TadD